MICKEKKTGKLFNFCCLSAAIIANRSKKEKKELGMLGEDIGLLFQLIDDFLDIYSSNKLLGKQNKKDKKKGKSTLLSLFGIKKTQKYTENLKKKILRKLLKHGKKAEDLKNTIEFIYRRRY